MRHLLHFRFSYASPMPGLAYYEHTFGLVRGDDAFDTMLCAWLRIRHLRSPSQLMLKRHVMLHTPDDIRLRERWLCKMGIINA